MDYCSKCEKRIDGLFDYKRMYNKRKDTIELFCRSCHKEELSERIKKGKERNEKYKHQCSKCNQPCRKVGYKKTTQRDYVISTESIIIGYWCENCKKFYYKSD